MDTLERLQNILMKHYPLEREVLSTDARLAELDIDSLGMMELFFAIEDEFQISVPNDKREFTTVGEVVVYIDELSQQQQGGETAQFAKPVGPDAGAVAP